MIHKQNSEPAPDRTSEPKWGASVARCPPNRAYLFVLGSEHHVIVIGTCKNGPVTAEPCRAKTMSLPRASILFRPRGRPVAVSIGRPACIWWRRRVLPPGPLRLFHKAFIAIVGRADRCNIGTIGGHKKARCRESNAAAHVRGPARRRHNAFQLTHICTGRQACGQLRSRYDRIAAPVDKVANVILAFHRQFAGAGGPARRLDLEP